MTTRVAHYNHTGAIAGAERVLLQALAFLKAQGVHSTVVSPAGPLQYETAQLGIACSECFALNARFTSNPLKLARYFQSFFQSVAALRKHLRSLHPDVVHANSVRAGLVATLALARTGIPVVWHVHDTLPAHPLSVIIRAMAAVSRRTSLIAVSKATAQSFAGNLWRKTLAAKTSVLHNAVELPETAIPAEQRSALRKELGAEGRLLVGCVGQLCARKNQIALVEMFREVLQHEPSALLALVGTAVFAQNAGYERALHSRIKELGLEKSVLLLGSRRDVPALLETFDLLVLPSRSEPFGMILLEAAAAGLATVAFRVDGVPELLEDRRTAWLIPPGETQQMSRTIVWALRHPEQRHRLGQAARADLDRFRTPPEYAAALAQVLHAASPTVYQPQNVIDATPERVNLGDAA